MTRTYPEDSIQDTISDPWWVEDRGKDLVRGRLIRAFLPYVDQVPLRLVAEGRSEASEHRRAKVRIEPLEIRRPRPGDTLPVSTVPLYPGEERIVQRAKKRPALIISEGGLPLPRRLRRDRPRWQTSFLLLVAPYYGGEQDGTRAGYPKEFLDRVRRCEFPQFMVDFLPPGYRDQSVLYLNQIQPLGKDHGSIELLDYRLSDQALAIMDEWVTWLVTGLLPQKGYLMTARDYFTEMGLPGEPN
jgi:hypothetical protein